MGRLTWLGGPVTDDHHAPCSPHASRGATPCDQQTPAGDWIAGGRLWAPQRHGVDAALPCSDLGVERRESMSFPVAWEPPKLMTP